MMLHLPHNVSPGAPTTMEVPGYIAEAPFNPEVDIGWHSFLWAEGSDFVQAAPSDGQEITTWQNETGEQSPTTTGPGLIYRAASHADLNNRPALEAQGNASLISPVFNSGELDYANNGITVLIVFRPAVVNVTQWYVDGGPTGRNATGIQSAQQWLIYGGATAQAGTATVSGHVAIANFIGLGGANNATLDIDSAEVINAAVGGLKISQLAVGSGGDGSANATGLIAMVGVYVGRLQLDANYPQLMQWLQEHYSLSFAGANQPPQVVTPIQNQTSADLDTINLDISNNFIDPEGQPLTYTVSNLPLNLLCDVNTGLITGVINPGASGGSPYSCVATAEDDGGLTVDSPFTWTVLPQSPVVDNYVNSDSQSGTEDGTIANPYKTIGAGLANTPSGTPGSRSLIQIIGGTEYTEQINMTGHAWTTLQGVLDPQGRPTVKVNPPALTLTWVPAPEMHANCWKTSQFASEPFILFFLDADRNAVHLPRIREELMQPGDYGETVLQSPNPWLVSDLDGRVLEAEINFWDGIFSAWGRLSSTGELFLRIEALDKDTPGTVDPNTLEFYASYENEYGFEIRDDSLTPDASSHNCVKDIQIQGFDECFSLRGSQVNNTEIANCYTRAFRYAFRGKSNSNAGWIHHNEAESGFHCRDHGAYTSEVSPVNVKSPAKAYKSLHYHWNKGTYFVSSDWNYAISLQGTTDGYLIEDNHFHHLITGFPNGADNTNVIFRRNFLHNLASPAFTLYPGLYDCQIYDNTLHDCQMFFRLHNQQLVLPTLVYIFNNRCWNPAWTGTDIFIHTSGTPDPSHQHILYHNSFSGGSRGYNYETSFDPAGQPGLILRNNIVSNRGPIIRSIKNPATLGEYDANWHGGLDIGSTNKRQSWYGNNNIEDVGNYVWPFLDTPPNWVLPQGHAAIDAAIPLEPSWPAPVPMGPDLGVKV